MKELLEELIGQLNGVLLEPDMTAPMIQLAGLVYLANSISAAGHEIADAIQCMGELDTQSLMVPFPRDEYDDN